MSGSSTAGGPALTGSLRVGVNMTWCRPGRVGGSEEYLCRQLLGLPTGTFDVAIYAPRGFSAAHPEIAARYRIVEMPHDAESKARRIFDESTWLYRRTTDVDLSHHGGGTIPRRHRVPTLLTIHDLQYLEYPQYFSRVRLRYLRTSVPLAVRSADLVAVPTQFVRRTVVENFGVDADGVVVVPHGIETSLGTDATSEEMLRSKYRLGDGPVVVFPAITHPHKGHEFLLDVHAKHWARSGITLVLIGGRGAADSAVRARIDEMGEPANVRRLGRVPAVDRDGLIKMATALVFPSEYEGFGAPVIEAMTLGTPVVTSDRACLPEVVGSAGVVLPLNHESWAEALDIVQSHRDELVALGHQRSSLFTSAISGSALASAYDRFSR